MFEQSTTAGEKLLTPTRLVSLLTIGGGLILHLFLLLNGSYKKTYDAFVHIFFGFKYAQEWHNTWVYNWFEGFDLTSYPPLTHQLIAIASWFISLEHSYVLVQMIGLVGLVSGTYRFSRIWLSSESALFAAASSVLLTSYSQAVHQFGQLPTTFAAGFALHAGFWFYRWLTSGHVLGFYLSLLFLCVVIVSHHLTFFLFSPILLLAVSLNSIFSAEASSDNIFRKSCVIKILLFALISICLAFIILRPFVLYVLRAMPTQIEIPHATRFSYFKNQDVFISFFAVPIATIGVFIPIVPAIAKYFKEFRVLAIFIGVLLILGLGGTTPIPKLIFRGMWKVFTFDRFMLWMTLLCLPFVGFIYDKIRSTWLVMIVLGFQFSILIGYFLLLQNQTFQPKKVDFSNIAKFLDESENVKYRYLTLGFGCQIAELSYLTKAATVDGLYYTARTPKILRESGIEAIDFAKYAGKNGERVLLEYLKNPERYSLKHVITNDEYYNKYMLENGWKYIPRKVGGNINLWETPKKISPLPESYFQEISKVPLGLRRLWGAYPVFFFSVFFIECVVFLRGGRRVQKS